MQQMQHFYEPMPDGKGVRPQCGQVSACVVSLRVGSKRQKCLVGVFRQISPSTSDWRAGQCYP